MYTEIQCIYNEDRGAERISNRHKTSCKVTKKGLFAEVIGKTGIFDRWAEGEYLSDCRIAESYRFLTKDITFSRPRYFRGLFLLYK